jgi:flagellin-like protein
MKTRKGISPFLATIILVVITLTIGGLLYTQFQQLVVSQVRNPSMDLTDINVAPNGQSIIVSIKNDGNVPITLSEFTVNYNTSLNTFKFAGTTGSNVTVLSSPSGGTTIQPGDILTAQMTTNFAIPAFASFTVTAIGNQLSRAFNVEA